jgi:hypothetical protein
VRNLAKPVERPLGRTDHGDARGVGVAGILQRLHDFAAGPRVRGVPGPDAGFDERKVIDEKGVPLNRIAGRVGGTM